MNKNLKKVISTVAALAVSASSFVALAAQSFPDVAETATYAQAVDELVALGVINGYTDGTFGPDKAVTRAEITKMIVVALGQGSTGEATTGQDTEFTDVPGTHWASGYVSVGVSTGFINGMGDGTFAPDSTVQYAQAVKMLVSACGYGTAATNAGGYPSGYMSIASQNSMLTGLSGVSNSTELNRGQVAQLIDNAMKMPLTLTTGGYTYDAWGNSYPETDVYDGEGDDYQTLLTKYHDTYVVYGRVIETNKSGSVDADEVRFRVEKADNFDGVYYDKNYTPTEEVMKYGDTNAPDLLFTYAQALVQEDDDDFVILSITASGKVDTKELEADDYDSDSSDTVLTGSSPKISFYTNEAQTKYTSYKLSVDDNNVPNYSLYVNGKEYDGSLSMEEAVAAYIGDNNVGKVTLIDETEEGTTSTDGKYDIIMVTYYVDATFDQISTTSSYTRVQFQDYISPIDKAYLEIDEDDDDKSYDFVLGAPGEGTSIAYTDLQTDDVLSIAYDVTGTFSNSDFYDVYVSRDTVTGTVNGYDADDDEYEIDGTDYETSTLGADIAGLSSSIVGDEYTFYLNVFGKVSNAEEGAASVDDIVVLESLYQTNDGTWTAKVIRADGDTYTYDLKNQSNTGSSTADDFSEIIYGATGMTASSNNGKAAVQNRVAKVKINSKGEISLKDDDNLDYTADCVDDEYSSSSSRIGSIRIDDSTVILDFTDYDDDKYGLMSHSSLVDDATYTAYGYERSSSSSVYKYVIVTEGNSGINGESEIAVLISAGSTSIDGQTTDRYRVCVGGNETYLYVDPDETPSYTPAKEGTPFFYTTSSAGYIDEMYPVLTDAATELITAYDYKALVEDAVDVSDFNSYILDQYRNVDKDGNEQDATGFHSDKDDAGVSFGPVMDRTSSMIQLASNPTTLAGETDMSRTDEGDRNFNTSSSTKVYSVKINAKSGNKVESGTASSVIKSSIYNKAKYDYNKSTDTRSQSSSGNYVDWSEALSNGGSNDGYQGISLAVVKEYKNDVTDVVVYSYE